MKTPHFNTINITCKRFGRLVAIEPTNKRYGSNIIWKCKCDCGKLCYVNTCNLKNSTKSCGCLKLEKLKQRKGKETKNRPKSKLDCSTSGSKPIIRSLSERAVRNVVRKPNTCPPMLAASAR